MSMNLRSARSVIPGLSRDQTRIARARLAELMLKMQARRHDGRVSEPPISLRSIDEYGAG
jgi:hypothetical protein